MVTRRASSRATQGSFARLWAEFTDPGPCGDAPVFLAKYASGFGPGCMGLVFMIVGAGVALLGTKTAARDHKVWVPIVFGAVFALAGFAAFRLGISTVLSKAAEPRDGEK
jgi:hypothetical protein